MKVAVVYWSGTGNTEAMAHAVAKGAADKGAEVSEYQAAGFNSSMIAEYDAFAFGCPAMGAEELEDSEFEPMFAACESELAGKKVGIFGSFGWGDGEWMRSWADRCRTAGINLVNDGVMCNDAPDGAAEADCQALGAALV